MAVHVASLCGTEHVNLSCLDKNHTADGGGGGGGAAEVGGEGRSPGTGECPPSAAPWPSSLTHAPASHVIDHVGGGRVLLWFHHACQTMYSGCAIPGHYTTHCTDGIGLYPPPPKRIKLSYIPVRKTGKMATCIFVKLVKYCT